MPRRWGRQVRIKTGERPVREREGEEDKMRWERRNSGKGGGRGEVKVKGVRRMRGEGG